MTDVRADLAPEVVRMLAADRSLAGPAIQVLSASGGRSRVRWTVRGDQVNGHDRAHGGLVFMLADTAMACAVNSMLPNAVTAGAEVSFLRAAVSGDVLIAEAEIRTLQGRTAIVDVTVRCGTAVIAEVRGRAVALRDPS